MARREFLRALVSAPSNTKRMRFFMDEKDCELLLELYELKNITKVSQKLFITQPAITKRIQRMEEELQCQLLLRSKKGVIFTPVGETIVPYAASILKNSRLLKEQAAASQEQICGTLNLGTSLNFSHYRLPAILKRYTEQYPLVDVQIITGQSRNLFRLLQKGAISIAIVRGEYSWDGETQLLSSEPMCLVCSSENRLKPLNSYPYIGRHTDSVLSGKIQSWLNANGLSDLRPKFWIDNIDTCVEMARYGLGWCILPRICLENFDGYTQELTLDDGRPFVRKTYVLYKKPYDELPQVKLFLEELKK